MKENTISILWTAFQYFHIFKSTHLSSEEKIAKALFKHFTTNLTVKTNLLISTRENATEITLNDKICLENAFSQFQMPRKTYQL